MLTAHTLQRLLTGRNRRLLIGVPVAGVFVLAAGGMAFAAYTQQQPAPIPAVAPSPSPSAAPGGTPNPGVSSPPLVPTTPASPVPAFSPLPVPPPLARGTGTGPRPAPSPKPLPTFTGTAMRDVSIGFHGMFTVLPGLNIPLPVDPSPADPVRVTCAPSSLQLAVGARATASCLVASQNGFSGSLTASCLALVADGNNLSSQALPACTTPATVVLDPGGTVTVPMTIAATVLSPRIFYLALYAQGEELQGPNMVQLTLPPPPRPDLNPSCRLVTGTAAGTLLAQCTLGITASDNEQAAMNLNFGTAVAPAGAPPATWPGCFGLTGADVQACAGASRWAAHSLFVLDAIVPADGFWLAIGTGSLAPGAWQVPVYLGVGSSPGTVTLSFTVGSDGTVSP